MSCPTTPAGVIDATAKVVAPGFIDLHSHAGLMVLADPRHEPKVRQGVTTEVIGVDGNSYAPFDDPADLAAFVELNAGLDGHPEIAYDWDTVAAYLTRFDRQVSVNIAYLVGNSVLRIGALGWNDVPAGEGAIGLDALDAGRGDGRGCLRAELGPGLPARLVRHHGRAGGPDRGGRPAWRLLPHPRPLPARRWLPGPVPGGDRDRPAGPGAGPHHPFLPSGHVPGWAGTDARAGRTSPGPRARTSPSTPTRPSGPAPAC